MSQTAIISLQAIPSNKRSQLVSLELFEVKPNQLWSVIGNNGSGKTTFMKMLTGEINLANNQRTTQQSTIVSVSFEQEQKLLEREISEDDSEFIDRIDQGRTTRELISELQHPNIKLDQIIRDLQLENFLDTGFKLLSTGERRRMMIARALAQKPDFLVLDEPFDGLDHAYTEHLKLFLHSLTNKLTLLVIVNRESHILEKTTHLAALNNMQLILSGPREDIEKHPLWNQLLSQQSIDKPLPSELPNTEHFQATPGAPIVELKKLTVGYQGNPVIDSLDWNILPAEHWKISGPNGSGKSTLVNIISGDHPQCYSNDIHLFGKKRGLGESIWDIKKHMGLMSTTLHQQYRISINAESVILSGFFDSIGVYRPVSPTHKKIATEWLEFLNLTQHKGTTFQQLSFGQQRMLLIARALIKRPYLLILDEPCQGLDPINRALVINLIEQIARRKIAQILYISHEAEDKLNCITHELNFNPVKKIKNNSPKYSITLSKA